MMASERSGLRGQFDEAIGSAIRWLNHAQITISSLFAGQSQTAAENGEPYAQQHKLFMIIRAMVNNSQKPDIRAHLRSLIEPHATLDISLLYASANSVEYIGKINSPDILVDIVSSLPFEARDAFCRFMMDGAIQSGRCDMVITLAASHRPLLEQDFLLSIIVGESPADAKADENDPRTSLLRAINQGGEALLNELGPRMDLAVQDPIKSCLIKIFVLFKLGQGVLKHDQVHMQNLQSKLYEVLEKATHKVTPHVSNGLSSEHRQSIRALFEMGKEGRYINSQGQIEGELRINSKTFLKWALDKEDYRLIEVLFLAGADTRGVLEEPCVRSLIAKHGSFDRLDEPEFEDEEKKRGPKATTVIGALLQAMPMMSGQGAVVKLIATYAQPTLPLTNFGLQTDAIQASLNSLHLYMEGESTRITAEKKSDEQKAEKVLSPQDRIALEEKAFMRAKTAQGLSALADIVVASSLHNIMEKTESYLKERAGENIDPPLNNILTALQGYTAHLKYRDGIVVLEDGAQPRSADGGASRRGNSVEFFVQSGDDGRPLPGGETQATLPAYLRG